MSSDGVSARVPLGNIAECQYGLSEPADPDGDRLYIGMGQLRSGRVVADGANRLTVSAEVADKYALGLGDVLFNRTNSLELVGKTAIVADSALVGSVFASYLVRLNVDRERYDSRFLNLWMNTRNSIARLRRLATPGVAQFNIRPSLLAEKFLVPAWPLEQQRVVAELDELLGRIAGGIEKQINAKRTFKRGLMQQLLTGRKRFPEFRDRPWVRRPFSDYFVEKSVANADRTVDLVYSCTKTAGIVPQAERFGKRLASKDLARYKVIEPGDLVYDPMLLWDGSIGFVPSNGRGVVSPAYETFAVKDAANREYFWPLFKSYNLVHRYKQISQGTNTRRRKAHPSDFLKTVVPMPPTKEEQDRIADVLCTAQREIDQLAQLHELIEAQRRALLSKLLSGSLAVP